MEVHSRPWGQRTRRRAPQRQSAFLVEMYRAVEAKRVVLCTTGMVSNELHSFTKIRRTAASVEEMLQQTQLKLLGCYNEDEDSFLAR